MSTGGKDQFYFAPMEGITGYLFRNEFHRQFDTNHEITKYFGPFVAATREGLTKSRDQKDVDPQNNQGITLVPQLLGNSGEYAIPYLEKFEELGYGEVNLNIGCPYGTVVSKKKGAGLLAQTELLENYLEAIFAWKDRTGSTLSISVKTRSGMNCHEEWEGLVEIYNQYPLSELILHPRIGTDLYANHPQTQDFAYAVSHSKHTLCYNGDLFTKEDFGEMKQLFPENTRWMFGRGLLVNPSLLREIQGGPAISREEFLNYQDNITNNYVNQKWGDKTVLFKMKELWNKAKDVKYEDVRDSIEKSINDIQKELKDLDKEKVLSIAKKKGKEIEKKANELYDLAVEKGTPVLEKAASDVRKKTIEVLNDTVAKLEKAESKAK